VLTVNKLVNVAIANALQPKATQCHASPFPLSSRRPCQVWSCSTYPLPSAFLLLIPNVMRRTIYGCVWTSIYVYVGRVCLKHWDNKEANGVIKKPFSFKGWDTTDKTFSGVRGPDFTKLGKDTGWSSQHCTFVSEFR